MKEVRAHGLGEAVVRDMLDRSRNEWGWFVVPWIRDFISKAPAFKWSTTSQQNFCYACPNLPKRFQNRLSQLVQSCISLVRAGMSERLQLALGELPLALCRLAGEDPLTFEADESDDSGVLQDEKALLLGLARCAADCSTLSSEERGLVKERVDALERESDPGSCDKG